MSCPTDWTLPAIPDDVILSIKEINIGGAVNLTVPGPPVGKSYGYRGRKGGLFLKKKAREYQKRIAWYATFAIAYFTPSKKIQAIIIFRFFTKQKKKWGELKYTKPDIDNLIKTALDGLKPLIGDDSKVNVRAIRRWGDKDETVIRIRNIK